MVSRVGYLGPEGTFSEEALLASAVPDAVEPVPLASIYDTVMALRDGDVDWALVPIENSLDGSDQRDARPARRRGARRARSSARPCSRSGTR